MKIITGSTGENHILPEQDAMWHRGMTGIPSGVFDAGSKFTPTKISNNIIQVADGCLSIQGRFMIIDPKESDEVTIANGSQGKNRVDIICGRVFQDVSVDPPVAEADLYVFQGVETQDEPIEPTIPERDLDAEDTEAFYPLIRVELSGLEITSVTMIGQLLHIGGQIDDELSETSENAVQNKVITNEIKEIISTLIELLKKL